MNEEIPDWETKPPLVILPDPFPDRPRRTGLYMYQDISFSFLNIPVLVNRDNLPVDEINKLEIYENLAENIEDIQ